MTLFAILMNEEMKQALHSARSNRKNNRKFIQQLARRKNMDNLFHQAHQEVFAKTDCLACANCCRTTSPIFRDVDINRIADHLNVRPSEFTEKNLHIDEDGDWVLNQSPCLFLDDKNYCRIYEVRPKACREYPHTDRKNMPQIAELTFRNTLVCPAVSDMVEKIRRQI